MFTLIIWLRWCLLGFSTAVTVFLFVIIQYWGRYFETIQIPCFCLNFHSLIKTSIGRSSLQELLLWYSHGDFLFPSFLLYLLIGILLEGTFVSSFSFIYLLSHFCILPWTHSYLFYSLCYTPISFCYIFCCSSCSSFVHLELVQMVSVSFPYASIF